MQSYKYIVINSYDRPNSNESDSNFSLSITGGTSYNRLSQVAVARFVCTNSVYNVDSSNNSFSFQEDVGPSATALIIPGNYSLSQIIPALQSAMNAVSPNSRTYVISSSNVTNKLTITASAGTFNVIADNGSGLNLMLGFSRRTNSSTGLSVIAPRIYNLSRFSNFVLKSNLPRGDTYNTVEGNRQAILDTIPISESSNGDIFVYHPTELLWRDLSYSSIEQISLRLCDEKDKDIDLQGGFMSVYLILK
jgi:hypothetical protein